MKTFLNKARNRRPEHIVNQVRSFADIARPHVAAAGYHDQLYGSVSFEHEIVHFQCLLPEHEEVPIGESDQEWSGFAVYECSRRGLAKFSDIVAEGLLLPSGNFARLRPGDKVI